MKGEITVLISSCGTIALGPSLVDLLSGMSVKVRTIGLDMSSENAGHLMVDKFYKSPKGGTDEFVDFVKDVCISEKVDIILGTSVENVLFPILNRKKEFEKIGVKIPACDIEDLKIANNKILMLEHLRSLEIPQANFYVPKDCKDFIKKAKLLGYPSHDVVVKPSSMSGNRGFKILSSNIDMSFEDILKKPDIDPFITLETYCSLLEKEEIFPEILMMEYLPGQDYSVYVYAEDGEAKSVIPMKRLKPKPGVSLISQVDLNKKIIERAKVITRHFNLNWNVNIQMRYSSCGQPLVYEINPRIAGSIILTKAAGCDLLSLGINQILGEECKSTSPVDGIKMYRHLTEVFV